MGATPHRPKPLLSLLELSRQAKIPYAKASKLFYRGDLVPDFQSGSAYLFLPKQIETLTNLIKL
jgi:hypothetical protein